jgi:hypothetical protein
MLLSAAARPAVAVLHLQPLPQVQGSLRPRGGVFGGVGAHQFRWCAAGGQEGGSVESSCPVSGAAVTHEWGRRLAASASFTASARLVAPSFL